LCWKKSSFTRDALSKAIYERVFQWLVAQLNKTLAKPSADKLVIGVLDIYGFEVFDVKRTFSSFSFFLLLWRILTFRFFVPKLKIG
jgi:hypothetical protein